MKTTINLVLAIGVLALVAACGQKEEPKAVSLAGKVAAVDAGAEQSEGSPSVVRATAALAAAARTCNQSELEVADMSASTKNILKGEGLAVSVVEVLETIPQVIGDAKIEVMGNCSRLLAGYAAARHSGQNHAAATNGMRGLVKVVAK